MKVPPPEVQKMDELSKDNTRLQREVFTSIFGLI